MTPRIAVIGDLIVDHYVHVEPIKVSQEAPVIAYRPIREEYHNGGAGAVRDMILALGVEAEMPILKAGPDFAVTRKCRHVAGGSRNPSIVHRLDVDVMFHWTPGLMPRLLEAVTKFEPTAIVISDYGKGTVCDGLVAELKRATHGKIPIIIDPYTADWSKYAGGDIILPSRIASAEFLQDEDLRGFSAVITKLDAEGIRVYGAGPMESFPSQARNIIDVTSAGDQFIATLAATMQPGTSLKHAAWLANLAAGMQCERPGIVPVTAEELRIRSGQIDESVLAQRPSLT